MTVFQKLGVDIASPVDGGGSQRGIALNELQGWMTEVETVIDNAFVSGSSLIYLTKAALDADLAHAANTLAWVVADSTAANNGIYQKNGASGSGTWGKDLDLPYSFIRLTDAGAGTANAIVATSPLPLPSTAFRALFLMNVYQANTGAVTIAVNGASAKSLKTNSGGALSAGYLTAGMLAAFVDDGTNFRLISDVASAAIQAASELEAAAAEEWANNAEDDPVSIAAGGDGSTTFSARHWAAKAAAESSDLGTGVASSILVRNAANDAYDKAVATVTSTARRAAAEIVVGDTHIDVDAHYKDGVRTDDEILQAAFDDAPVGAHLHLTQRTWTITNPMTMGKVQKIFATGAAIWAASSQLGGTEDLLTVKIQTAGLGTTAGREFAIYGGNWYTDTGRNAIRLLSNIGATGSSDDSTGLPLLNAVIANTLCESVEASIRIIGIDNHFIKVVGNAINSGIHIDKTGDGNQIINNIIAGDNTAVVMDLVTGAFNTIVAWNALVANGGAMDVYDGDMILFLGNQVEHANSGVANPMASASHIVVRGNTRIARNNQFLFNNFGTGSQINTSITFFNARYSKIDYNQFNVPTVQDVNFSNAVGSGSEANYNVFGPNNGYRGTRSLQSPSENAATDITRRAIINDQGVGNRGIWKDGSLLTLANSWAAGAGGLRWMINQEGDFVMDGSLTNGTLTAGTQIMTLLVGSRPHEGLIRPLSNNGGAIKSVFLNASTGAVTLNETAIGTSSYPQDIRFPANFQDTYEVGP